MDRTDGSRSQCARANSTQDRKTANKQNTERYMIGTANEQRLSRALPEPSHPFDTVLRLMMMIMMLSAVSLPCVCYNRPGTRFRYLMHSINQRTRMKRVIKYTSALLVLHLAGRAFCVICLFRNRDKVGWRCVRLLRNDRGSLSSS